ncbi:ChbG/HpnK family deacetylase [Sphingomonas sp. MA1305]|uniref:ChbG/HpnK family deacetylase n=1 Tax=Sphingomonas sp. MA1305 TaxID=2479204 RepID=UPI0018DF5545|nr:ChbG/HpnK family deacetylase [Sphingomonas sp. MA1305]MBI0474694.1 ChbG/HpnK family deacetylase [Sphingomonas sp. MA1305]
MPRLILCADDFAFSRGTSETIVQLLAAGKLNATSCMTVMPGWAEDAELLRDLPPHAEVGLHLTLTGETPLTAMPETAPDGVLPEIDPLCRLAARHLVALDEIAREVRAQFDAFIGVLGRPPAFVDGHQHSHALTGIRDVVLAETARRAPEAWVRDCTDTLPAMLARPFPGKAIGSAYHCRGLRRDAARHRLRCNRGFAGHYDFASNYNVMLPKFLRRPGDMHLVMCHPGAGRRNGDAIADARPREAAALQAASIADMAAVQGLSYPA